ncbi:hypothetical protein DH2020_031603 [Rehmannia glutinosa]|uniref:UDP-N-acetylglucosamine 1-carboxyvinyltransferase n=1 Tax=Rehmannia glutinosa TaxID=99300 RepID=A0ABR0VHM9_REHGL
MASNFNPYPNPSPIPPTPHHPKPQTHFSQSPQTLSADPNPDPKLVITGGAKLSGHVSISGSKNSALPILAATLCCTGTSKLKNVPNLSDTRTMTSVLGSLGAEIEFSDNEVVVKTDGVGSVEPDPTRIGKFRGGFFVVGPLLARFGEAVVGLPGGCDIGARPVDIYVSGLRALGAVVEVRDNKVVAKTANGKRLAGGRFRLDYPSVGATETLMMAACLAEGKTLLSNVAREPEIIDLARFLTKTGAHMEGVGTDKICIYVKSRLLGAEYGIMPDRIETGSFMLAAAITRSRISLSPVFPGWLSSLIDKLVGAGCKITHKHNMLEVSSSTEDLRGFDVGTLPYPGFPTDLQPQTMAFLSTCNDLSIVDESVFENRMTHVKELQKLGAKIQVFGSTALIYGKEKGNKLCGTRVLASDLRGGMSIVLAGLAAEGVTEVNGVSHIDRGYENLENKLRLLGADVKRFEFSKSNLQQ